MSSSSASATMNDQEPLSKNDLTTKQTLNLPIPYDLVLNCLARVSRLHYPVLSLVSKSFRTLIYSPELYQTRSLLNRTETCLYLCLRFAFDRNPRLFTLCRKPKKTLINDTSKKEKESSGNVLVPISIHNSPYVKWSRLVAVGPNLYAISGPIQDSPCSSFSFLDCRTHTWLEAPNLRLAHTTDCKYDRQMYLAGSCENPESLNSIEVFNKETQTWKPVPPEKRTFKSRNMEGKIYMIVTCDEFVGKNCVVVNPKESTWEVQGLHMDKRAFCMINNIAYCYDYDEEVMWLDFYVGSNWKKVEGLEELPKLDSKSAVKLMNYGGKMVILWDKYARASGCKDKTIWCAEIALERRNSEEIWGKVEWFDAVLTVPKSCKYVCAVAATV